VQRVGLAKTHKTASSTVQNLLLRWGLRSAWNFALHSTGSHLGPPTDQYRLDRPFQAAWLGAAPWRAMVEEQGYNCLTLHTMWSQQEVEKVLGGGGEAVRYITILRDPVDQFESLYSFVHFEKKFNMNIEEFVSAYVVPGKKVSG
jgi:hypothetical protein